MFSCVILCDSLSECWCLAVPSLQWMWDVLQEAAAHWSSRTCQLSAEFQLRSPKHKGWEKCSRLPHRYWFQPQQPWLCFAPVKWEPAEEMWAATATQRALCQRCLQAWMVGAGQGKAGGKLENCSWKLALEEPCCVARWGVAGKGRTFL